MKADMERARTKRAELKDKLDNLGDHVDERAKDTRQALSKEIDALGRDIHALAQRVDKEASPSP